MPETNEIGNRIFGIGAEAFERSMFIGAERKNFSDPTAQGELNARLSSVALTGDADTSFEKIEKRITSAKEKVLSKTEKAGALANLRKSYAELEARLQAAKRDADNKSKISNAGKKIEKNIAERTKKLNFVKTLLDKKEDMQNAEKLKQYLELKDKLDELNEKLKTPGGKTVDSSYVSKIKFCKARLDPQREAYNTLLKELENLKKTRSMSGEMTEEQAAEKCAALKDKMTALDEKKTKTEKLIESESNKAEELSDKLKDAESLKKPFNLPLLIIGIALCVAGVAAGALIKPILFAIGIIGLIVAALGFVIKPNNEAEILGIKNEIAEAKEKTAEYKNEQSEIARQIADITGEITSLNALMSADKTIREKLIEDIKNKEEQINEAKEKLKSGEEEYLSLLDGMDISDSALSEMEKRADEQKEIKVNLGYLSKDLGGISYEQAREKLNNEESNAELETIDFEKVEREYENLTKTLLELEKDKSSIETELKTAFRNSEQPEIIAREMSEMKEKIEKYESFVRQAEICLQVLGESFASIRKGYGVELNEKTLENFKRLTNGKYKTVSVDKSLSMMVEKTDSFGLFETGYLSSGTEDQALLALRLAICELMSDEEKYPVFLDDALCFYDDERSKTALRFLKEYGESGQIVLFTCHGETAKTAHELSIANKRLK